MKIYTEVDLMKCQAFSHTVDGGSWECCLESGHEQPHEWVVYIGKHRKKVSV